MNFGERVGSEEMVRQFFNLCEEEDISKSQMEETVAHIENNLDEFEFYNDYVIRSIRERMEKMDQCPSCQGDFLYDEENEEQYCPVCE